MSVEETAFQDNTTSHKFGPYSLWKKINPYSVSSYRSSRASKAGCSRTINSDPHHSPRRQYVIHDHTLLCALTRMQTQANVMRNIGALYAFFSPLPSRQIDSTSPRVWTLGSHMHVIAQLPIYTTRRHLVIHHAFATLVQLRFPGPTCLSLLYKLLLLRLFLLSAVFSLLVFGLEADQLSIQAPWFSPA